MTFEQKYFCDFPASQALKEVGFDEGVMAYYNADKRFKVTQPTAFGMELLKNTLNDNEVAAPLHAQAVEYLREKHGIDVQVNWKERHFEARVLNHIQSCEWDFELLFTDVFVTKQKAYNASITKACEIVKEKLNK